jgi:cation:H+ antiporter
MIGLSLLLAGGLVLLWKGADFLSDGAVGLAERMGVSKLVIGLTIVATGTSAPELAAGIVAAWNGKGDIILGDVFGANIADLALIGGLVTLIQPLRVRARTLRREIPAMLAVILFLWPILRSTLVARFEGAILVVVFAGLLLYTIRRARRPAHRGSIQGLDEVIEPARTVGRDILWLALGLAALTIGARMAVHAAVALGGRLGLSDAVIGSTILAIGTTLPELMTCLVAAVKGHHDLSVGNLVGSVIFNSLLVVGVAALVRPLRISPRFAGGADYWILMGIGLAFTATVLLGRRSLRRSYGAFLLAAYAGYILYLLRSTGIG